MSQGRQALLIARVGFRRLFRDRLGLFFVFIFPVQIILIIGISFFDSDQVSLRTGVVVTGSGNIGEDLVRRLDSAETLDILRFDDAEAMKAQLRREGLEAGVVIPAGYDESLRSGEDGEIEFVFNVRRPEVGQTIRRIVVSAATEQGALVRAATFAAARAEETFEETYRLAGELPDTEAGVSVEQQVAGVATEDFVVPTGFSYPAASNLILFTFITTASGAAVMIANRRAGITSRILGGPTTPGTILIGEGLARFSIGLFQGVFIFAVGWVVFDADYGDPWGAAAVILSFTLVAAGAAMLLSTFFRSQEPAQAIAPPLGIGFGMLGGCMWPLETVSETMRTIGHATPHAWAMDAFVDLIGRGEGLGAVLPEVAVLLGFAVIMLAVGTWRLSRMSLR